MLQRVVAPIKVKPPRSDAPIMSFTRPTHKRLGGSMTTRDPYERKTVYVKDCAGRGEGVFAKRNISKGEIVAYYSGLLINTTQNTVNWYNISVQDWY